MGFEGVCGSRLVHSDRLAMPVTRESDDVDDIVEGTYAGVFGEKS